MLSSRQPRRGWRSSRFTYGTAFKKHTYPMATYISSYIYSTFTLTPPRTVKGSVIEIQGDHRDVLVEMLAEQGWTVRRSG